MISKTDKEIKFKTTFRKSKCYIYNYIFIITKRQATLSKIVHSKRKISSWRKLYPRKRRSSKITIR